MEKLGKTWKNFFTLHVVFIKLGVGCVVKEILKLAIMKVTKKNLFKFKKAVSVKAPKISATKRTLAIVTLYR